VPPDNDIRAATSAIRTLLLEPDARERALTAAPAVLARYSWDTAAQDTLAGIEKAARP